MWPFRRRRSEDADRSHIARKIVVGLVIGGAISSIIGKKLLDKAKESKEEEDDKDEE